MKRFSIRLIGVYLIFATGMFFSPSESTFVAAETAEEVITTPEQISLDNSPEYTIIKPQTPDEVLLKREGDYVYSGELLSLDELDVALKKEVFIHLLLPAIDAFERELQWKKYIVEHLRELDKLNEKEGAFLRKLFEDYKVKDENIDRLLSRMIMPPRSLIISQGALESGWGTSRFFKEANNLFGVWSYNTNEPRIPAQTRSNGYTPYLRKYESIKGSVEDYILLLSRSSHYSKLREGIKRGESSVELAEYLTSYSELGDEYVKRVIGLINTNELDRLD